MKANANEMLVEAVAAIVSAFSTGCAIQADDVRTPDGTLDTMNDNVTTEGPPPGARCHREGRGRDRRQRERGERCPSVRLRVVEKTGR